jgi:hypothetical protein
MKDQKNTPKSVNSWNAAEARMSFFMKPITNKWPTAEPVSLFQVYQYVHTRRYLPETRDLRAIDDDDKARQYKGQHLDYITPSGIFSYCSDTSLVCHSSILCMDLDYLGESVEKLFELLIHDPMFETLLLFRSPRGQGLKWFIHIDLSRCDHRTWFQAVRNYLMHTYHLTDKQVDKMCGNPSRACFLCYDPDAYLAPNLYEYY